MAENTEPEAALIWKRTDDFKDLYCNNVRFESSVWDLKVLFGTLDQGNPNSTEYQPGVYFHTGISMPWVQAKIALYQLYVAILFQEMSNGTIQVPAQVRPPRMKDVLPDLAKQPAGQHVAERADQARNLIFG